MPLIVFEGAEGAGKSTQIARVAEWLGAGSRSVLSVREPGGTPLGDEVRRILLDPESEITPHAEALLFMASRAELVERVIGPALAKDTVVLVDRFFLSTYAYQVVGRGLPHEQIDAANRLATGALRPDLTLLITLPLAEGMARAERRGPPDRMEQAESGFHERVASAFAEIATREWQNAHPEAGPIMAIDGSGSTDDVFARIRAAIQNRWPGIS